MISLITAILISQLRFIDYRYEEYYQYPDELYHSVKELRFVSYDKFEAQRGDHVCFVFEEVGPREVCGTIRANVDMGLSWVTVDLD